MKNKTLKFNLIMVLVSLLSVVLDQFTKWLAVTYVKPVGTISVIKFGETEWVNFTYCENTGMSFSLLEGQRFILIALPILLIGIVEYLIFRGKIESKAMKIALAFLAGGGLGNLIDRIFLGYVVDFIDFRIINFAIFNFADICAVLGGFAFAIMMVVTESREEKRKKLEENKAADDGNS
ncbi:MAG: signal peptidase II [Ruminiclostridium sp.]|nr:signal peptidase II [Ruminiclostridium sp.]